MIVGFKGDSKKLSDLYKKLGLQELLLQNLKDFEAKLKNHEINENVVIVNYNDLMKSHDASADIIEKQEKINGLLKKYKDNLYLGMTTKDISIDRVKVDVAVETATDTKDMWMVEDLYDFVNTDKAYNTRLDEDEYIVKEKSNSRGEVMDSVSLKKLIMN